MSAAPTNVQVVEPTVVAAPVVAVPVASVVAVSAGTGTVTQQLKALLGTFAIPDLTSAQVSQLWATLQTLLNATDVPTLLEMLPNAAITLTQDLASFYVASHSQQAAVVSGLLQIYVGSISGLTTAQVEMLQAVISKVVTKFVVALPKIESGLLSGFQYIEQQAEATTCWQKFCGSVTGGSSTAAPAPVAH